MNRFGKGLVKTLALLAAAVLAGFSANAQSPFICETSIIVAPSTENLVVRITDPTVEEDRLAFGWKATYNFGAEFKYYLAPGTSLSTGAMLQDKGFRNLLTVSTSDSLSGNSEFEKPALIGSAKYLTVPLNLNMHFKINRKSRFLVSPGIVYGRLVTQNLLGKRISPDQENTNTSVFKVESGKSNIDLFNRAYVGFDLGLGFTKYIKDKMVLTIQPHYIWQRNNALNEDSGAVGGDKIRFNSFLLDIRFGYYYNSQIKNRRKDI